MIDEKLIDGLREYLKNNYVTSQDESVMAEESIEAMYCCYDSEAAPIRKAKPKLLRNFSDEASDYIKKNRKPGSFAHALEQKRSDKGLSPAELYKKANIDRRHYSRLMGPEGRHPSMNTAISFALALGLKRCEFDELLQTAGYALSNNSSRDVCVMYCLEKGIYSIDDVNALLFAIGIEPLTRDIV